MRCRSPQNVKYSGGSPCISIGVNKRSRSMPENARPAEPWWILPRRVCCRKSNGHSYTEIILHFSYYSSTHTHSLNLPALENFSALSNSSPSSERALINLCQALGLAASESAVTCSSCLLSVASSSGLLLFQKTYTGFLSFLFFTPHPLYFLQHTTHASKYTDLNYADRHKDLEYYSQENINKMAGEVIKKWIN